MLREIMDGQFWALSWGNVAWMQVNWERKGPGSLVFFFLLSWFIITDFIVNILWCWLLCSQTACVYLQNMKCLWYPYKTHSQTYTHISLGRIWYLIEHQDSRGGNLNENTRFKTGSVWKILHLCLGLSVVKI